MNLYKNGIALLELGFGKLESNYEAEEWWPVVSGVRQSVMEGKEGLALLDDTFDDLSKVYDKTEWWPVAEAVEAFARDFQGRQEAAFPGKKMSTDLDYAGLWKQFQQVRKMCAYGCVRI